MAPKPDDERAVADLLGFEHYMALVDGLFALRAVCKPSDRLEAEIAEIHERLWHQLTDEDQKRLDPELIEQVKRRWGQGVPSGEEKAPLAYVEITCGTLVCPCGSRTEVPPNRSQLGLVAQPRQRCADCGMEWWTLAVADCEILPSGPSGPSVENAQ